MMTTDCQFKSQPFYNWLCLQSVLVSSPIWGWRPDFFFISDSHRLCGALSLMGGWVYHLKLLLGFASTVILKSEFHRTHDRILLPQIQDNLEGCDWYFHICNSPVRCTHMRMPKLNSGHNTDNFSQTHLVNRRTNTANTVLVSPMMGDDFKMCET